MTEPAKLSSDQQEANKKKYKIAGIFLVVLIIGVVATSIFIKNGQDTRKEAAACVEQCPGSDNILRNCTPPESPGNSADSSCAWAGRKESCGGVNFCCPSAGGKWTKDMTACTTATPTATLTATPSATLTATPSATLTATPSATLTATVTATKTPTPTATKTPNPTKTPTPTATKTVTPTPTKTPTPTATPTPTTITTTLPASGSLETTFLLLIAGLFSVALGVAIKYKN